MNITTYGGGEPLSSFRLQRLLLALQADAPALTDVAAREIIIVAHTGEPETRLGELLNAEQQDVAIGPGQCAVVPRLGTTSPWSSKATDIARVCGFDTVERIERGIVYTLPGVGEIGGSMRAMLHDRMTESLLTEARWDSMFSVADARPLRSVALREHGREALSDANVAWGLALSDEEIDYLVAHYRNQDRDPTDGELMMFAQINSEHCRHKIFNATWEEAGETLPNSLFDMIRQTHAASPQGVLSAYKDNAAVVAGPTVPRFFRGADGRYQRVVEPVHQLMKVETHNHPTGIAPHPGAATGAGGEIRDEAATGRGGRPKAGLCGFSVSELRLPDFARPWERDDAHPQRMASPLEIMRDGPIGAAAYNNEFGRPNLCGYFRSFRLTTPDGRDRGYHKPIMIAGGMGNVRPMHVEKNVVPESAALIVLGGPAMLIGLGGGAASSMATGSSDAELDFASVQRANPELERRCQEVIDVCWAMGDDNPIVSIHDVGAGGLSNALPEIIDADGRGGRVRLSDVAVADASMSPMEIWCNESQERYVLAIAPDRVDELEAICARERCPVALVGEATAEPVLVVSGRQDEAAVDMPMSVLLGKTPRMTRQVERAAVACDAALDPLPWSEWIDRVLTHPTVASKSFLITIGDRTVGGLTARDQMVGPWQVPVADHALTTTAFDTFAAEAMAMGERSPVAIVDAAASARLAVGEALTNLVGSGVATTAQIRLSANWMAACGQGDEDARLFDAVRAVGSELCPALGLAIPVGKDSLSMKTVWSDDRGEHNQTAPMSLIVSAFAQVEDVRTACTPQLRTDAGETALLLVDLSDGRHRMGGSIAAQVQGRVGGDTPDLENAEQFRRAIEALYALTNSGKVLACHDRSDGGLVATLLEMAFAGHCGLAIDLDAVSDSNPVAAGFCEELGVVIQVDAASVDDVTERLSAAGARVIPVARPAADRAVSIVANGETVFSADCLSLLERWSETSLRMQALRDEPQSANEARASLADPDDHGLFAELAFDFDSQLSPPAISTARPRVAILREQGVNGHVEMAYAFDAAGFDAVDVHMTDILSGEVDLADVVGLAACGGFSYGDVLGAGQGWARSILFNSRAREVFGAFLANPDRFALGVCNGCQMMATLHELIPGTEHWPRFVRNRSEQFEARFSQVGIPSDTRSMMLAPLAGSSLPVAVAHGEGRALFGDEGAPRALASDGRVAMQFVSSDRRPATRYPANPNGSPDGLTGLCNSDGRVTIMMPHPERNVRATSNSWRPEQWRDVSPWFEMFRAARRWVD